MITARNILALCLRHGARLAEPGEFTRRAFLAGKLDLTQAEAVMDVITAKTDRAQAAATRSLEGHLSARVNHARDRLVDILAHIEATIDFPEEDIAPDTIDTLRIQTESVAAELQRLLDTAREGRILREGVAVAIVGRPNAGKSSLLNALLGHERAIVTEIPGTTRDTIDDYANIGGVPVRLTDTAGIRDVTERLEQIGVERSQRSLATADLVIHVIDGSETYHDDDLKIAGHYGDRPAILAINKSDLPARVALPPELTTREPVRVSAVTGTGLDELRDRLLALLNLGVAGDRASDVQVNERHARALGVVLESLEDATSEMAAGDPPEIIAQNLRGSLDAVGEIVGKTATEDILDKIFSKFCIGK
jgi:tRNA modification GTPase